MKSTKPIFIIDPITTRTFWVKSNSIEDVYRYADELRSIAENKSYISIKEYYDFIERKLCYELKRPMVMRWAQDVKIDKDRIAVTANYIPMFGDRIMYSLFRYIN